MDKMPMKIKKKIRQLQSVAEKSRNLTDELYRMFEEYGVSPDLLNANADGFENKVRTEALAFVSYAEGDVEDNIESIEEVFLYYVNNHKNDDGKDYIRDCERTGY